MIKSADRADHEYVDISSIALQSLQQADTKLENAASRIARAGDSADIDTVEISTEMVALLSARNEFTTNLRTLKTADEMRKTVIDLLA